MAKICIVSHFAYGAFAGGRDGHAGGVERQTTLMANWLTENGHEVTLITWDVGQKDGTKLNGVTNLKLCKQSEGYPIVRFFYPRWTSLIAALRRADADAYYHNCAEYVTGQIALWCKMNNRKFVFSVPSDPDCDKNLPKMSSIRERVLYRYGLNNASALIVQTETQRKMLENGFSLDSTVVPMPCPVPDYACNNDSKIDGVNKKVLWVGRISREKQLELLLDTAEKLPEIHFFVAGKPKEEDDYVRKVIGRAKKIKNVTMLGMVPRENMDELYCNSSLLCCTSHYEGFPNTFLEAWSHGVPVVSTVDPDDVIERFGLGAKALGCDQIVESINKILNSSETYKSFSDNAKSYFMENHTLDSSMSKLEKYLI